MGGQLIEGKGVSRTTSFRVPPELLIVVGVDTPHKSFAEHPRFDPRVLNVHAGIAADDPRVQNIKEIGVQTAIKVEVEEIDGVDQYVVVEGRGRTLKARLANKLLVKEGLPPKTVPVDAYRKTASSAKLGTMMGIVLNEHRDNDTLLNQAEKMQYLLSTGYDVPTVAQLFRVTEPTIGNRLALLKLSAKVQKAVSDGEIAATSALELIDLTHGEQDAKLAQILAAGGTSGPELKRQREVRKQGGDPVVRTKAVSRTTLRKLITDEEFVGKASPETQALLAWILGEGKGGQLWRTLRKVSGSNNDSAVNDGDAE